MLEFKYSKENLFKSIGADAKLKEEIIERMRDLPLGDVESLAPTLEGAGDAASERVDRADRLFQGRLRGDTVLEAIVLRLGRPVIRVLHDDLVAEDIPAEQWKTDLAAHREVIRSVLPSVGRIEVRGHPNHSWLGTGWVLEDDVLVTNRHVAAELGRFNGVGFEFLPGVLGRPIQVSVDFLVEHQNPQRAEFQVREVLFIEPAGGPDLAFLRVHWADGDSPRGDLALWDREIDSSRQVAVIGYPARDPRTDIMETQLELFHNIYEVKRFAPGAILGASETDGVLIHDCTTLGGNSGSSVIDLETGQVVALHFGGLEERHNSAVLAPVVQARLRQVKSHAFARGFGAATLDNEVIEEARTVDELTDRAGYDPAFLGVRVALPTMTPDMKASLAPVEGRDDGELKYTHYSVLMNQRRGVAFYAVVNIDGNQLHGVPRASDKWFFDPRIDREHQVGNELYRGNALDRGHLARRLDPCWGATRDIAKLAVEDSFFYTNCAPQHLSLNRGTWRSLEDHILNNTGDFNLKVTVFSGPVFHDDDQEHRGIQIPNEFWKVVAMVRPDPQAGERLSVTGYLLSQRSLIDNLEFVFGEHQGFQVKLEVIEELTGLDFGPLKASDPLTRIPEDEAFGAGATPRGRRLLSFRDLVL